MSPMFSLCHAQTNWQEVEALEMANAIRRYFTPGKVLWTVLVGAEPARKVSKVWEILRQPRLL